MIDNIETPKFTIDSIKENLKNVKIFFEFRLLAIERRTAIKLRLNVNNISKINSKYEILTSIINVDKSEIWANKVIQQIARRHFIFPWIGCTGGTGFTRYVGCNG